MASRRFTASLCTHSQRPYNFSGTVRQRWLHIHHRRKSSSLKMQNNIPGPESLRNNNILLCKAKLGKSTHWSEKMVLAFTVVTVQSCFKKKKRTWRTNTYKQNNGNVLELSKLVNSSHVQKKVDRVPSNSAKHFKGNLCLFPSELQLFHPEHLWPFPDLCAQRIYFSFKSSYFYILILIKQKKELNIKLL